MAPKDNQLAGVSPDKIAQKEKERLLNKITGYKEKNPLYKDAKTHNKMGKDEFLKLLTVQLKNQDPFNPMEQNKMAAELAEVGPLSLKAITASLRDIQWDVQEAEAMLKSDELAFPVFASEDAKEGMKAFKEKRKANFQGK